MKTRIRGAALALGAVLLHTGAQAALEAKMYAVTTWNAGCSGSTRSSWDDMAEAWYNDISISGTDFL
jgi:hypothetical protein